jgi:hypothetical protein
MKSRKLVKNYILLIKFQEINLLACTRHYFLKPGILPTIVRVSPIVGFSQVYALHRAHYLLTRMCI